MLSLPDESEQEGEKGRPITQEEEDIEVIRSWVEAGGHPARQEGEAKELLSEVSHIPMFLSFFSPLICLLPAPSQSLVPWIVMCLFLLLIGTETAPRGEREKERGKEVGGRG